MKLDSNNHSMFSLHYYLVFVVKDRREVFTDETLDFPKYVYWDWKPISHYFDRMESR